MPFTQDELEQALATTPIEDQFDEVANLAAVDPSTARYLADHLGLTGHQDPSVRKTTARILQSSAATRPYTAEFLKEHRTQGNAWDKTGDDVFRQMVLPAQAASYDVASLGRRVAETLPGDPLGAMGLPSADDLARKGTELSEENAQLNQALIPDPTARYAADMLAGAVRSGVEMVPGIGAGPLLGLGGKAAAEADAAVGLGAKALRAAKGLLEPSVLVPSAIGGAIQGNLSYTEAKDKGFSANDATLYALAQGGAEMIGEALPLKWGAGMTANWLRRVGGLKEVEQAVADTFGSALKRFLVDTGAEISSEMATTAMQAAIDQVSGMDPHALEWEDDPATGRRGFKSALRDTFWQTLLLSGGMGGPGLAMDSARAAQNRVAQGISNALAPLDEMANVYATPMANPAYAPLTPNDLDGLDTLLAQQQAQEQEAAPPEEPEPPAPEDTVAAAAEVLGTTPEALVAAAEPAPQEKRPYRDLSVDELEQKREEAIEAGDKNAIRALNDELDRDRLTGLYGKNRGPSRKKEGESRSGGRSAMIDVDTFKKINDTYGHAEGDRILGKIIEEEAGDDAVRYGGEEFKVYLDKTGANDDVIRTIAERVPNEVKTPDGQPVTISAGISNRRNGDTLVADDLLYEAKRAGRNQIHLENPDGQGTTVVNGPKVGGKTYDPIYSDTGSHSLRGGEAPPAGEGVVHPPEVRDATAGTIQGTATGRDIPDQGDHGTAGQAEVTPPEKPGDEPPPEAPPAEPNPVKPPPAPPAPAPAIVNHPIRQYLDANGAAGSAIFVNGLTEDNGGPAMYDPLLQHLVIAEDANLSEIQVKELIAAFKAERAKAPDLSMEQVNYQGEQTKASVMATTIGQRVFRFRKLLECVR